jgi:hypothetical protein
MAIDRPPPSFRLLDILLVVAATAMGLAGLRIASDFDSAGYVLWWRMNVDGLAVISCPILVAWTLLVLFYKILNPSPSRRAAIGEPGFVACFAALIALIDASTEFAFSIRNDRGGSFPASMYYLFACAKMIENAGWLILGSWMALSLAGRLRPGLTWLDRFGCLVGLCWLVEFAIRHAYFAVFCHFGF